MLAGLALGFAAGALFSVARAGDPPAPPVAAAPPAAPGCPAEMVRVGHFCVDRWEASLVDVDSGRPLSPYYPPNPKLLARMHEVWQVERDLLGDESARALPLPIVPSWQRGEFQAKAVSQPGVVPQGYLTYHLARRACENADKRLCTEQEWVTACRGQAQTMFPYGADYRAGRCNVHRKLHPAYVLHGSSSIGHTDPRLNLVVEALPDAEPDPLLRATGATPGCASAWRDDAIWDMVGNLDEWIEDPAGVFAGGFYARRTTKGCSAKIVSHAPSYFDYSTGTRCCRDLASP
jgi:formylglycine-generating enzyme